MGPWSSVLHMVRLLIEAVVAFVARASAEAPRTRPRMMRCAHDERLWIDQNGHSGAPCSKLVEAGDHENRTHHYVSDWRSKRSIQ